MDVAPVEQSSTGALGAGGAECCVSGSASRRGLLRVLFTADDRPKIITTSAGNHHLLRCSPSELQLIDRIFPFRRDAQVNVLNSPVQDDCSHQDALERVPPTLEPEKRLSIKYRTWNQ